MTNLAELADTLADGLRVEATVIGSMLLSTAAIDDVAAIIDGPDYASPRHELIHDAIVALHADGHPVDALSVTDRLTGDGNLRQAGGAVYLHQCIAQVATPASAEYHARQVKAAAYLRTVRQVGDELTGIAEDATDPLEAVNAARARLDALVTDTDTDQTHEAAIYAAIESLEAPVGLKTPWLPLTRAISGWAPGMLYVVGARPGVGKTVLAIGTILDCARRGEAAVMFSLEMPKTELYLRMLSAVGTIDGERILHRTLGDSDWQRLAQARADVEPLDLTVDERSHVSLAQIRAKVRSVQRQRPVGVVVVDYLGLVKAPPEAGRNDRRVQVDAIAQGLKNLARDLRVPIVALAQLNRGIEGRTDKEPTMADLRESGGIEAAADVVVLMHRDTTNDPRTLHCVLPKNRHGPQSRFTLHFEGAYSRAVEPSWTPRSALGAPA